MQKIRIASVWNNDTKSYEKGVFEIRESDKAISGKVNISSKKDDKYISKTLPFIAFKSKIDELTTFALLHSKGKLFDAEFNLMVDSFEDSNKKNVIFIKLVINEARLKEGTIDKHNEAKANGYQPQQELIDDEIMF